MFSKCFCGEYVLNFGGKLDEHRVAQNCAGGSMIGYCASPSEGTIRCHYCSRTVEAVSDGYPNNHSSFQPCKFAK